VDVAHASTKSKSAQLSARSRQRSPATPQRHDTLRARGATAASTATGIKLTNPERVLYPDQGLTKRELAEYYTSIADWVLPHVVDRPLTIVRCPHGRTGQCFYQKHWKDTLPEAVDQVAVQEKSSREMYLVIHDLDGLISLVQVNVLELHPWGSRIDRLEHPDRIVFDLDPGDGVPWETVRDAAREVRDVLEAIGLVSFVRTSGGKGLHVVVPLQRRSTWDKADDFARRIAAGLAQHRPDRYVANMRKALRKGKIFVDYLRNKRGATSIASYSTRSRAGAPVATPFSWSELDRVESAVAYHVGNIPQRLTRLHADPWEDLKTVRQSLTKFVLNKAGKLLQG
jgi:bifunctional non-homologous end joining protein LigD